MKKHHYHSPYKRGFYSLGLVISVVILGTLGIHHLEDFSYMHSFYFTSMIATGQGPVSELSVQTTGGKIFTSLFSFVSAGVLLAAMGFVFGPFLGKLWHIGFLKLEEEVKVLRHDKKKPD